MAFNIKSPRKLIEVALPLDAISAGCEQEKNPFLKGHPRAMHLWWARRPLAAARAVIFAQMVNDPGYQQGGGFKYGKNKKEAAEERKRLFRIIEKLVQWDNTSNESVLVEAREEIRRSWREVCELNRDHPDASKLFNPENLPGLHDPFAGGGAIPLEAQRLGLDASASDLNPVAVTINKAMIEIPPMFANRSPVGPSQGKNGARDLGMNRDWPGASGLAEDVRRYGSWMRQEAQQRIGHLYPPIEITSEIAKDRTDLNPYLGQKLNVIAWIWVRTVKSPNPIYSHVDVPLASTYVLSTKIGKEAYVLPVIDGDSYRFTVKKGKPTAEAENGTKLARGANFKCILSGVPISGDYIKSEGKAGRMGYRLMGIVADGSRSRIYLPPVESHERILNAIELDWVPELEISGSTQYLGVKPYGMTHFNHLFTKRQLFTLDLFSKLVSEAIEKCYQDALKNGILDDKIALNEGGQGALAYAQAIGVYLACGVSHLTRYSCTICGWNKTNENVAQAFGRQAIPMVWDFAESNPINGSLDIVATVGWPAASIPYPHSPGHAYQCDAQSQTFGQNRVISTDPPYYDNVPYADLSDFFYVWLRRSLKPILPDLFATVAVPKTDELVAFAYRHNGKTEAEAFFLDGMTKAIQRLSDQSHPAFPISIYYAFRQAETEDGVGTSSPGWETFLEAVIRSGFGITGTWPMRTERTEGLKGKRNALASCIVLVCRRRETSACTISRREFIRELNAVLPEALDEMTKGTLDGPSPVAPVDLAQAIIGPGMAVFSKYSAVLEADGSSMSVRTALQMINRFLAEDDFDADTQWCLHWFEQNGWKESAFGDADVLARSKATSVNGLVQAGVVEAGGGSVRLLRWAEYPSDWDPRTDARLPIWEVLHHLIRKLKQGGETPAGAVVAAIPGKMEAVRQLAYRLYTLCERQSWSEDARAYNELITSWSAIESAAPAQPSHQNLFD